MMRRAERPAPSAKPKQSAKRRNLKGTVIVSLVVPALFATMALPAYAIMPGEPGSANTVYAKASNSVQTLVVAADAAGASVVRDAYAATTPDELAAAKAAAAAEAAAAAAKKKKGSSSGSNDSPGSTDFSAIAGAGEVRWPLAGPGTIGDGFRSRGGAHDGVDILIAGGTPIGAVADGVVRISSEGYFGYGVAVIIDHVIAGQKVSTLYGHMTYGTRTVKAGQKVTAGQVIGLVGSTGRSTANHLHFEVTINGSLVDPIAWLRANGV